MTRLDFLKKKQENEKISMITCYDFWSARLLNTTEIDCILVGDSLAMVMHGHESTIPADSEIMALHTRAVSKGAPDKFIVGDMPFLSTRKGLVFAMDCVESLMKAGAQSVKIEGLLGHFDLIKHIVESGVPVMGHLGLTPQSIHQLGGFRVQGRGKKAEEELVSSAKAIEDAGAFALVLECVPTELAQTISQSLTIPTIGIGAGPYTDGQVLVLQDMLGMNPQFKPKFLKHYASGAEIITQAVNRFHHEIRTGEFPTPEESYSI